MSERDGDAAERVRERAGSGGRAELELLRETFSQLLSQRGFRMTQQRWRIVSTLVEPNAHFTVASLFDHVRERHPRVGYSTVYRTLRLLSDAGVIRQHSFGDGLIRYELALSELHDHLICTACGSIFEFRDAVIEAHREYVAVDRGFRLKSHKHELYGVCAGCLAHERD